MIVAEKNTLKTPVRISQAAQASGVAKGTIEYYIMLGLIRPLRQPDKPGRFFDEQLIARIRLIRRLNRGGYTLRSIRETYLRRR